MATQAHAVETYIFLCNPECGYSLETFGFIENRQLPEMIKLRLLQGECFFTDWSCANNKSIQVGDSAYLLKTVEEPRGIIASGRVATAPEESQLRHSASFSNLSATYVGKDQGSFYVYLALDSVVDFDHPLELSKLKSQPVFQGVNFYFAGSGKRFAPDNPDAIKALASAWESHSLVLQNQDRGCRLVDVFIERGEKARKDRDYKTALYHYYEALAIDPTYAKALNKTKICESLLEKSKKEAKPSPIITPPPEQLTAITSLPEPSPQVVLQAIIDELEQQESPTVPNNDEARKRVLVEIARRRGQSKFRQALLDAYDYKCAVTGFDADEALEAAHITSYVETEDNDPTNGLLLRADIHTLFDLNLLAIHPETLHILLHPKLQTTEYRYLQSQQIRIPNRSNLQPNPKYLEKRLQQCTWLDVP